MHFTHVKNRVKKSKQSKYIAAMVIRFATQSDYYLIADKAEEFKKFGIQGEPKTPPKEDETKM